MAFRRNRPLFASEAVQASKLSLAKSSGLRKLAKIKHFFLVFNSFLVSSAGFAEKAGALAWVVHKLWISPKWTTCVISTPLSLWRVHRLMGMSDGWRMRASTCSDYQGKEFQAFFLLSRSQKEEKTGMKRYSIDYYRGIFQR